MERCEKYKVKPCFAYASFSSSAEKPKFRLLFCCEFEVTDYRIRSVIQLGLMRMFKESDKSCKDGSRFFYGGKEILYEDFEARINPVGIVESLCWFIKSTDSPHTSREIKFFCESVGFQMRNGLPKILMDEDKEKKQRSIFGESATTPFNINIGDAVKSPKIDLVDSSQPYNDDQGCIVYPLKYQGRTYSLYLDIDTKGKTKKKSNVTNEKIMRQYLRSFDFEKLLEECTLCKEFVEGSSRLEHAERFGVATNLLCVQGGREFFMDVLREYEALYEYDVEGWEYQCNHIVKLDYVPMRCDNFCPYVDACEHAKNILEQIKTQKGRITIISEPEYKSLEQAEIDLDAAFREAMEADDNKIHVIKAPTGIGKTKRYLNVCNVTIALPNHALKEEVAVKMREIGTQFTATPAVPTGSEELKKLYGIGAYGAANSYIRKQVAEGNKEYIEYMRQLDIVKKSHGTLLTTHERMLYSKDDNSTIIIDEDIIQTLLKYGEITMKDLETIVEECGSIEAYPKLQSIRDCVKEAKIGIVQQMPSYFIPKFFKLERILANKYKISTNVTGFLNCDYYVKDTINGTEIIKFMSKRELPNKKIIILSATVSEVICKLMFGDRVIFKDIGEVKTKGKIYQYPEYSYSRYQMRNNNDILKLAQGMVGKTPVITYKEMEKHFENPIAHVGATAGLDAYKGQDIVSAGTPHVNPSVYLLMANVLGKRPKCKDCKSTMEYTRIKWNGYIFYFNTFSDDPILQEIQFYLIESELVQAIGRSRALRTDCTVTVLSNFPVRGAEFKYLTSQEKKQLITA